MFVRRRLSGFSELDIGATVAQMDSATDQLRAAWQQRWNTLGTVWFVDANAINNRMLSLQVLINDLGVGGVARQRVFFPPAGFTQEQTWQEWQDLAEYVRQGLNQVGATVGNWRFTSVAARAADEVKKTAGEIGSWTLWLVGGLVAIEVIRTFRGR